MMRRICPTNRSGRYEESFRMNGQPIWLAMALLASTSVAGWSDSGAPAVVLGQPLRHSGAQVEVSLHAADTETMARVLGGALGATVRVEALGTPAVTLDLQGATGRAAL